MQRKKTKLKARRGKGIIKMRVKLMNQKSEKMRVKINELEIRKMVGGKNQAKPNISSLKR